LGLRTKNTHTHIYWENTKISKIIYKRKIKHAVQGREEMGR